MLVGFYGTAALIGYIAPVSVVNVRMSAHAGLVGSYHLAPSNIQLGVAKGWLLYGHITCVLYDRIDLYLYSLCHTYTSYFCAF